MTNVDGIHYIRRVHQPIFSSLKHLILILWKRLEAASVFKNVLFSIF